MLDLGVWVSLQSLVEKIHKRQVMQSNVLSCSVAEAFGQIGSKVLNKVHSHWKLVLQLLISGQGTNEVVKEHHSLKKKTMLKDLPTIPDCKDAKGYVSSSEEDSDSDADDVLAKVEDEADDEWNDADNLE